MPSIIADIGGQTYYAWVTTSFVVSAIIALLFAFLAQRAFAGMGGLPHRTPVPVASLVPLVLATIAISLSAIVPIGWPTLATVGAGLALLVLFVLVERRAHNTILPRITYRRDNALKWGYLTVAALSAGVMVETFIPLFSQQLAGVGPLVGGLLGAVLARLGRGAGAGGRGHRPCLAPARRCRHEQHA
ncbi:hypothetical protein [Shinella granuli]|uniref:MFS transporter n=1 Tax=Shinella granuli TaxID=323621 RepID=A0A4V2RIN8_SHIGR|nr:hypothetical protein [Shinella granuli]TCN44930.1 hypothetical protein EV665_10869 [Shinella granuli]